MKSMFKFIFAMFGDEAQKKIFEFLSYFPFMRFIDPVGRAYWTRVHYTAFGQGERYKIFMSIARFAHINRPLTGYYMEFGSHEGNTMRQAWRCFRYLFDWEYIAFDSFAGLPEMEEFDRSEIFVPGNLATGEERFRKIVTDAGIPRERLRTVKGFYDQSLTQNLSEELQPKKAAVVYIDCDLYKSTVPVLNFIREFLQVGTVIVFDDWNCYYARPDHGERRAWAEFVRTNPELEFTDFVETAEGKAFICVKA